MRRAICMALACAFCAAARADVVRPAPDFAIAGVRPGTSLKSFRGHTVVLVIGQRAKDKKFHEMVRRLGDLYATFSTEKVIFVAAIETGPDAVGSNIPFVLAADPRQVAAEYGILGKFGIAVIGVDGNVDLVTTRVVASQRVRDMISNNYESQSQARKPFEQGE